MRYLGSRGLQEPYLVCTDDPSVGPTSICKGNLDGLHECKSLDDSCRLVSMDNNI